MASNPDNAIGTNGAYGGRTSVNAANDILGLFQSRGVLSGWAATPNTGLTISLGGDGSTRDVAIAEDNAGNKTTINNISQDPVDVTIPAAPASNSRIDLVVAYVDNPPQGQSTDLDNPGACGLIVVSGVAAATPVAPTDGDIRSAITADGATGAQAYYVVLASVTIPNGTTTITSDMISGGEHAPQLASVVEVSFPWGIKAQAMRVGNIVILTSGAIVNSTFPQTADNTSAGETFPAGYRPMQTVQIPMASIAGRQGNGGFDINPDGSMTYFAAFNSSGSFRGAISASWLTNDPWPTN